MLNSYQIYRDVDRGADGDYTLRGGAFVVRKN